MRLLNWLVAETKPNASSSSWHPCAEVSALSPGPALMHARAKASTVQLPARGRLPALGGAGGGHGEKAIGVVSAHPPGHLQSQHVTGCTRVAMHPGRGGLARDECPGNEGRKTPWTKVLVLRSVHNLGRK